MTRFGLSLRGIIERALTRYQLPDSEAAVRLLLMIAAHESGGFTYCKQVNGPALGVFQMEPPTYRAVLEYLERSGRFPSIPRNLREERLVFDADFAAAIARVYLVSKPEPLPEADDLDGLAEYAKKHWNTYLGKATPEQYHRAFLKHVWGDDHGHS